MVEQNKERQKSMSNILLLEDDLSLINGLSFAFKKQGFELNIARTLKEAEKLWTDGKYDLLVLDISLPDGSGFDFCKRVRLTSKVPIIFLTASDEETSAVEWHQGSFAARTGFQKWGAVGFDCRGIQATVLVYAKPKHGADKGTNFR